MHRWWRVGVCVVLLACGGKIAQEDTFGSGDTNGKKKSSSGYAGDDDDDTLPKKGGASGSTSSGGYVSSSSGYYGTSGYPSSSGDPYVDSGYYPPIYDAGPPYPGSSSSSSSGSTTYCPAAKVGCGAWSGSQTSWSCSVTDGLTSMTCSYRLGSKIATCSCGSAYRDAGTSFTIDASEVDSDVILKYWMGYCSGRCY